MADYLVLARKYRSNTFDEVVGQEHVAQTLKNAIASGRVAHAFLFGGTRGVGKTTMARILAKALNCLSADAPTATPCNKCDACIAIGRGDDVDVVEIDGASNRGIDDIRELRGNAIYRPNRCRYKIYYIDEVHMLTREGFNALLKTLEEPPPHVKFIFATTEPEKLPATILSRCQRFDFRNIPTADIARHLESICRAENAPVDSGAIFRVARAAAGSMRDGLSLLDQLISAAAGQVSEPDVLRILGTPSDERTGHIVGAIAANDPAAALTGLDELLQSGVTLELAIAAVGEMFRHMMLAATCGENSDLVEVSESQRKVVAALAAKFTLPALVQAVTICQNAARNLRGLTSGRGLVEAALVRLAASDKFVDAASLIERLERLGGSAGGRGPAGPASAPGGYRAAPGPAANPYEKKKPLTVDSAGSPAASPAVATAPAAPEPLPFDAGYLQQNWESVLSVLVREKAGALTGLLRPAQVLGVDGQTLRLGFPEAHEGLRLRCQKDDEAIRTALARVFGRAVSCEYVVVAAAPGEAGKAVADRPPAAALSTAQRTEISKDPAVKAVLEFFGGSIVDFPRMQVPAAAEGEDET